MCQNFHYNENSSVGFSGNQFERRGRVTANAIHLLAESITQLIV